jgi:predicted nucleotidyltransferase
MVTTARTREVAQFLAITRDWAARRQDIEAVALVGSWAHGDARMDSDVDLVILCQNPDDYLVDLFWMEEFEDLDFSLTRNWGPLTELRFRRPTGLEIEFGFAPVSWADTFPIDDGTMEVVRDGISPLHDPKHILARLMREVNR